MEERPKRPTRRLNDRRGPLLTTVGLLNLGILLVAICDNEEWDDDDKSQCRHIILFYERFSSCYHILNIISKDS